MLHIAAMADPVEIVGHWFLLASLVAMSIAVLLMVALILQDCVDERRKRYADRQRATRRGKGELD